MAAAVTVGMVFMGRTGMDHSPTAAAGRFQPLSLMLGLVQGTARVSLPLKHQRFSPPELLGLVLGWEAAEWMRGVRRFFQALVAAGEGVRRRRARDRGGCYGRMSTRL